MNLIFIIASCCRESSRAVGCFVAKLCMARLGKAASATWKATSSEAAAAKNRTRLCHSTFPRKINRTQRRRVACTVLRSLLAVAPVIAYFSVQQLELHPWLMMGCCLCLLWFSRGCDDDLTKCCGETCQVSPHSSFTAQTRGGQSSLRSVGFSCLFVWCYE